MKSDDPPKTWWKMRKLPRAQESGGGTTVAPGLATPRGGADGRDHPVRVYVTGTWGA